MLKHNESRLIILVISKNDWTIKWREKLLTAMIVGGTAGSWVLIGTATASYKDKTRVRKTNKMRFMICRVLRGWNRKLVSTNKKRRGSADEDRKKQEEEPSRRVT